MRKVQGEALATQNNLLTALDCCIYDRGASSYNFMTWNTVYTDLCKGITISLIKDIIEDVQSVRHFVVRDAGLFLALVVMTVSNRKTSYIYRLK